MFGLKEKWIAFLALVVGLFAIKSKFQESKIEGLEDENERFEKKDTIEAVMDKAEEQAEKDEITAKSYIDSVDWKHELRK